MLLSSDLKGTVSSLTISYISGTLLVTEISVFEFLKLNTCCGYDDGFPMPVLESMLLYNKHSNMLERCVGIPKTVKLTGTESGIMA